MIQLPNQMPTHGSDKVPRHAAWFHLEIGLNGHEIVSDVAWNDGWHGVGQKLEEWSFLVGQPRL